MSLPTGYSLLEARGRKYLTVSEREHFLEALASHPRPDIQTFAATLAHTGARVSEALALRALDIDLEADLIRFTTLKRRLALARLWPASYVIYCPLTEATEQPQVVLLLARAPQGLVLSEALSRVDGAVPIVMGRPACALIPQVVNSKRSAASLGCCGARVYLDVLSDDVALWGLNGKKLGQYVAAIEALAKANATLTHFHQQRRTDIEAGRSPSVVESLSRIPSEC